MPRLSALRFLSTLRPGAAALLAVLIVVLLTGCGNASQRADWLPPEVERQSDWFGWRAAKDNLFRTDESPLKPEAQATFDGLRYYPYDPALAFPVVLEPVLNADTLRMPTTTGDVNYYIRYGRVSFTVGGRAQQLTVFKPLDPDEPRLFVPFTDPSNRNGSYPGGRYIDLPAAPDGRYVLDLNYAYSPYCAYDPAYSCPVSPSENRLSAPVRAGEQYPIAAR